MADIQVDLLVKKIAEIAEENGIGVDIENSSCAEAFIVLCDIGRALEQKNDLKRKLKEIVGAVDKHLDFLDGRAGVSGQRRELAESLVGYSSKVPRPRKLEPNEIGDLMTYEEWVGGVECGGFIDYDGFGYYATEDGCDRRNELRPSQYKKGENPKPLWATHVLWFNR